MINTILSEARMFQFSNLNKKLGKNYVLTPFTKLIGN